MLLKSSANFRDEYGNASEDSGHAALNHDGSILVPFASSRAENGEQNSLGYIAPYYNKTCIR